LQTIEQQESNALRQSEKALEALNASVKGEIQALYDRLSSLYSLCRWVGNSIEILEEYIIDPPYDTVKVLPKKDGTGLDRMKLIVGFLSFFSFSVFDVFLSFFFSLPWPLLLLLSFFFILLSSFFSLISCLSLLFL
jgi:hypothetical protein